jgi:hypothetical protein
LFVLGSILPTISALSLRLEKNSISKLNHNNEVFEYLIVTSNYFEDSYFKYLINYKSQYISAKMVFIEDFLNNPDYRVDGLYGDATNQANGNPYIDVGAEVTTNFSKFDDTAARIRNFLRFAHLNWQTKYVLLGGDAKIIPDKKLRINETMWYTGIATYETFANIRSDLYYGALEGTWNCDFDEYFGEAAEYSTAEEADFTAELYVGRAPVDDKRDVKIFVEKVIAFETSEKPKNMLFHQAGLNQINKPDSSVVTENCLDHVPIDEYDVYLLYQIYTDVTLNKYVNNWKNPDKLIVLHVGSGENYFYYLKRSLTGDVEFSYDTLDLLDNDFYPVHISVSCNSGNFGLDHDCLAEEMLLYADGGPSACIFNSFYGVASPDNAHKYSGEFIEAQFIEIFEEETHRLGEIVTKCKYHFTDQAKNELLYRWCYYTVYLLGDPETSLFEVRQNNIPILDEVFVDDNYDSSTSGWQVTHFDNIKDAIDAVVDSGTIYVFSGTYNENLVIDKSVNLIGQNKVTTKIIGDGQGDVIKLNDEVTISGFSISNSGNNQYDSGLKITSKLNIVSNNKITNNEFGIRIISFDDNEIFNNNFVDNQNNIYNSGNNRCFGNYYDEYTGSDSDGDGIGNSIYSFEEGKDLCPFIEESGWASGVNHKPTIPSIDGPLTGAPLKPYYYDFLSADPDGDKIYYYIDMGDGAYSEWTGPFSSDQAKNIGYYWEKKGTYLIRFKARDSNGAETEWNSCTVLMPRQRNINFLSRIASFFPILNKFFNI